MGFALKEDFITAIISLRFLCCIFLDSQSFDVSEVLKSSIIMVGPMLCFVFLRFLN